MTTARMASSAKLSERRRKLWLIWRALGKLGKHRWAAVGVALTVLAVSSTFSLFLRHPVPRIHDEFSYLLQSDTFVSGRLKNPPHPMWQHFESFHVIQQPFYGSKYPPGQGAVLALGQIVWKPILGVWLITAIAIAAMFWVLKAFVPPPWAVAGTALAFCNPEVLSWNWNFWGGSLPFLGGALLIGGCWRMRTQPARPVYSAIAGIGMALLALTRPFEGMVLSSIIVTCFYLSHARFSRSRGVPVLQKVVREMLPMLLCAGFGVLIFAAYNYRVTGNPLRMPYTVYEKSYAMNPLFVWQERDPSPPSYRHKIMQRFYEAEANYFDQHKTAAGYIKSLIEKISKYSRLVWSPALILLVIPLAIGLRRNQRVRLIFIALAVFLAVTWGISIYVFPHYSAPAYPLLVVLAVFAFRYVQAWSYHGQRVGRYAAILLIAWVCVLSMAGFVRAETWMYDEWSFRRDAFLKTLQEGNTNYLVIVRYDKYHNRHEEWVYNEADIDGAKVVWARDLGEEQNRRLREYFSDREVIELSPNWMQRTAPGLVSGKAPHSESPPHKAAK